MPRAIWTGSISFGLVNVPVRMYSAIEEQDLHFNYVHEPDGSRIGYRDALCEVIRAKRKGKKPPKPAPTEERPTDLMAALRASLEATQEGRSVSNGSSGNGGLAEKSKDELVDALAKR